MGQMSQRFLQTSPRAINPQGGRNKHKSQERKRREQIYSDEKIGHCDYESQKEDGELRGIWMHCIVCGFNFTLALLLLIADMEIELKLFKREIVGGQKLH